MRNQSFEDGLPKYTGGIRFWRDHQLDIGGNMPREFAAQLDSYSRQFKNGKPNSTTAFYNLVMTYMRKGTISDLVFIIDKMLHHLNAIHGQQSHNQAIYQHLDFDKKKRHISTLITELSDFNHVILNAIDNGGNAALSGLVVLTGVAFVLCSVFALVPSVIGLGLMIGGAYALHSYVNQLNEQIQQLKTFEEPVSKMQKVVADESLFGDKNHKAFIASIVKPLPYAAITAFEQVAIDEEGQANMSNMRQTLDSTFGRLF